MSHAWVMRYLGAPWSRGADGPDAYDCWGLVRAVYRNELMIELPIVDIDSHNLLSIHRAMRDHNERSRWVTVYPPSMYDVAIMSYGNRPHHVGLWTGSGILHALEGSGVVHQSMHSLSIHRWNILGYYRRCAQPA